MYSGWALEIWVIFALSALIALLRIVVQTKMVGVKGWKGDDYMMVVAVFFFTLETIVQWEVVPEVELAARKGLLKPEHRLQHADLIIRSHKFIFAGWIFYTCTIWSLKGCLLFFYYRLTSGLRMQRGVTAGVVLCVLTFVASILTIFVHCTPIQLNWALNPSKKECQTFVINTYVIVTSNILTDAFLLCIPIPIIWRVRLPPKRKFAMALLMCSGVLVMFASAIRLVMTLFSSYSPGTIIEEAIWPYREIFIAMIVVNAPSVKKFFSSSTWLKALTYAASSGYSAGSSSSKPKLSFFSTSRSQKDNTTTASTTNIDDPYTSHSRKGNKTLGGITVDLALQPMSGSRKLSQSRQGSQEPINPTSESNNITPQRRDSNISVISITRERNNEPLVIMTTTTFASHNELRDAEEGRGGGSRNAMVRPSTSVSAADAGESSNTESRSGNGLIGRTRNGSFWISDDEEGNMENTVTTKIKGGKRVAR